MTDIYQFEAHDIDGNLVSLSKHRGKVLLIVNVASACGFTGQYTGLQDIYTKYKDHGFEILAFPAINLVARNLVMPKKSKPF